MKPLPTYGRLKRRAVVATVATLIWLFTVSPAAADREHTVRTGQSLARIAQRYQVSVTDLATANRISRTASLKEGQVLAVPERGVVYVHGGQSLASIARDHDVQVEELALQNKLKRDAALKVGMVLLLPGFEAAKKQQDAAAKWGRPKSPGRVAFFRVSSKESRRIQLIDTQGRLKRPALGQLRQLMRPRIGKRRLEPHPRLLRLIAQVSDHFGGRPVHIISGVRMPGGYTSNESRHVQGHAMDFRIPGVPLNVLRDYCDSFNHVGVGIYPRSQFIHLDVRSTDARWTDDAGPGEAPQYRRNGAPKAGEDAESAEPGESASDDGAAPVDDQPNAIAD